MSARHYSITVTAAAQRLSSVLPLPERGGPQDEAFRQLLLTCETDCFIGGASVTTTDYGIKVLSASTVPVSVGPFNDGPIKLSDLFVIGTSGKLHIFGIAY